MTVDAYDPHDNDLQTHGAGSPHPHHPGRRHHRCPRRLLPLDTAHHRHRPGRARAYRMGSVGLHRSDHRRRHHGIAGGTPMVKGNPLDSIESVQVILDDGRNRGWINWIVTKSRAGVRINAGGTAAVVITARAETCTIVCPTPEQARLCAQLFDA